VQEFFAEFVSSEANGLRMKVRRAFQHPDSGRAMLWAKVCLGVGVLIAVSACAPRAAAQSPYPCSPDSVEINSDPNSGALVSVVPSVISCNYPQGYGNVGYLVVQSNPPYPTYLDYSGTTEIAAEEDHLGFNICMPPCGFSVYFAANPLTLQFLAPGSYVFEVTGFTGPPLTMTVNVGPPPPLPKTARISAPARNASPKRARPSM
jgi:hypothetical protein